MRAVIFDVGGTLIRNRPEATWTARQLAGLRAEIGSDEPWFADLSDVAFILAWSDESRVQRTHHAVSQHLRSHGVTLTEDLLTRICWACSPPLNEVADLEPDAVETIRGVKGLGLRIALCTDGFWRSGAAARRDWESLGLGDCFDAYVTSLDIGYGKPHPAMFSAVLSALEVEAHEAIMVGDRPERDIVGAHALGIRTIWKRPPNFAGSCEPQPNAEIYALGQLMPLLQHWLASDP